MPGENVVLRWSLNKDTEDLNNTEGNEEVRTVAVCSEEKQTKRERQRETLISVVSTLACFMRPLTRVAGLLS